MDANTRSSDSNSAELPQADLIVTNARVFDRTQNARAVAIHAGRFCGVGSEQEVDQFRGPETQVINGEGRTLIPGLNDSHIHLIRGGLNYTLELRWDGVPSLADGLRMLKEQAARTPPRPMGTGGWRVD